MVVLVKRPADLDIGLTQFTSLSTKRPKIKLIIAEVPITAY